MSDARRDSSRTRSNCFAAIHSLGAIHEPPHATTRLNARYAATLLALTPPVGMNDTSPYGAAIAFRNAKPPLGSAGKNFTVVRPFSSTASISVGVQMPG